MLQHAFSRSAIPAARDPYFLYAASNLGSAISLLLYPLYLERLEARRAALAWRNLYVLLLVALGVLRGLAGDSAP